jgi:tetratricopeptide (TPR) repeat protein
MTSVALLLIGLASAAGRVDLYDGFFSFSGSTLGARRPVDRELLKDETTADVLRACAEGCSLSSLGAEAPRVDEARVRELVASGVLDVHGERYRTGFPVVLGRRRVQLQHIVDSAMPSLVGPVTGMLGRLAAEVPDRALLFHLMWSRVLDEAWQDAWEAVYPVTPGPPNVTWVIVPGHAGAVGTNYEQLPGDGSIAVSWSPHSARHIRLVMQLQSDLYRAAWLGSVAESARPALAALGMVGASGTFRAFAYHAGDPVDRLLQRLAAEYASLAAKAYDYERLSKTLDMSGGELFVILLHETAYEVLHRLEVSGQLPFPQGLRAQSDPAEARSLVSVRLGRPPQPEDDAVALFTSLGGRGNGESVAAFRKVLESQPTNQRAWLYLGLSLYEIGECRQALDAFARLAGLAAAGRNPDEARMRDWAHVWMGHMYDLLNERERAVKEYESVLASSSVAQHAQYDIGPTTAGEWARKRLDSPFVRR